MIAAIDSARLAAKDERAIGLQAQVQPQDPKFSTILHTAARRDPPKALAQLERPVSPAEAKPRSIYGEAARPRPQAERPEPRAETRVARREEPQDESEQPQAPGKPVQAKAQGSTSRATAGAKGSNEPKVGDKNQDRDKALNEADPQSPSADQIAGALMQPALVLTSQDIIAQANANAAAQHQSIDVQIGAAAYRLSPHGAGEEAAAQAAGVGLPPDYTKAIEPGTANNVRNVVRQAALEQGGEQKGEPVLVVDALAMVQLSKEAQAARSQASLNPEVPTAPQGSALARNQMLAHLAATPGTAPQATALAAAPVAEAQLKELPKDLGLPAKESAVKASDATTASAAAPASTGLVTARSADAAQPAASAPHVPDTHMVDKIVNEARWMISNKKQEVTMRLEPEHLGQLTLHVTQKDGAMHIEMTVDNAAAKHLLDSSISQLRERFQNENLAQGQMLHVDVRQGGNSEFAQQFGRQGAESSAPGMGGRGLLAAEEPARAAPRAAWSNSNVSIYA